MASKDSQGGFRSISGQTETAEPGNGGGNGSGSGASEASASRKSSSTQLRQTAQSSSSGSSVPTLRKSASSNLTPLTASPAPGASPRTSRNTSPIRQDKPPTVPSGLSTQPSAAAIQRALSASNVPQLSQKGPTISEAISKLPGRVQKSTNPSGESTPQWPISPRLKSPPPSGPNSRRGSAVAQQRRPDSSAMPSIQVVSSTPQTNTPESASIRSASAESQRPEVQLQAPPPSSKASSRGASGKSTLETVQENISDSHEPQLPNKQAAADLKPLTKLSGDEAKKSPIRPESETNGQPGESGSESAGNKSDSNKRGRRQSTGASSQTTQSQPPAAKKINVQQKPSHSIGPTAKERQAAGKQNMTVETETVQSIPQSQLATANDRANQRNDNSGTIKLKPSNETIRPKKERKKAAPKTRSINQGTATSKADLFEARVANAVDEANTSDSDETFVYESNPPEQPRRQRHHSRTPSVTSSHSMADQRGVIRGYNDPFDGPRVGGKRSMKFSTNPTNPYGLDSPDSQNGTVRMHTPKHIGKFGRNGGNLTGSSQDQDSPFTQASKLRNNHLAPGRSRPPSPRSPQNMQFRPSSFFSSNNRKQEQPYDFDAGQTADDERTPLMGQGTVRTPRRSHYHPHRFSNSVSHSMENYYNEEEEPRGCCGIRRWGGCLLTTLVLILVVVSALGFVFASNRPLMDVKVHKIHNVLASETELMLDLQVGAVNPNTLGISVSDLDVSIFARSKHVTKPNSTDPEMLLVGRQMRHGLRATASGDKNPNPIQDPDGHWHNPGDKDPSNDPEIDARTLKLGEVYHFDQALVFEASPIKQHEHISSGQLRLTKPGNRTESRGSAKWEEIILYPFELIIRGTIKYQLPISSRLQSVAIEAKTIVHPEEDLDKHGNMRTVPVDHSDHWQWVEKPELNYDDIEKESKIEELE